MISPNIDDPLVNLRCHQETRRPWLAIALTMAVGVLSGCGSVAESVGTVDSELGIRTRTFDFGITTRVEAGVCGTKCSKFSYAPGGSIKSLRCTAYVTDCSVPSPSATLHADAAAASYSQVFPAYDQGPSWEYWGCGPQAAHNVLNYYGVQMPIYDVSQYIDTFALIAGSNDQGIATFPDSLASGLQRLLDERAGAGYYTVQRHSGVDVTSYVEKSIQSGNPIILLVNGGSHYQVVTGYDLTRFHVIDYPGNDHWAPQYEMGMDLPWYSDIFSTVTFGEGGYEDYTVITIDYAPF